MDSILVYISVVRTNNLQTLLCAWVFAAELNVIVCVSSVKLDFLVVQVTMKKPWESSDTE